MPFLRSENPQLMRGLLNALLGALGARPLAALLDAPKVHLYTGATTITMDSLLASFSASEATFDGYTAQSLPALVGPVNTGTQQLAMHGEVDFNGASPQAAPQNVVGYYVTDSGATILYAAEAFPSAVPITNPGDFLSLDVILPVDASPEIAG